MSGHASGSRACGVMPQLTAIISPYAFAGGLVPCPVSKIFMDDSAHSKHLKPPITDRNALNHATYQVQLTQQLQHQLLHWGQHTRNSLDVVSALGVASQHVKPAQQQLHVLHIKHPCRQKQEPVQVLRQRTPGDSLRSKATS